MMVADTLKVIVAEDIVLQTIDSAVLSFHL